MNFKEALIAHLQGEKVEVWTACERFHGALPPSPPKWRAFGSYYYGLELELLRHLASLQDDGNQFRLAPRTIFVNGVEVPAPESVAPEMKQYFFCPVLGKEEMWWTDYWANTREDQLLLKRGLIYLNKEDAIARAKAMLLTSDK